MNPSKRGQVAGFGGVLRLGGAVLLTTFSLAACSEFPTTAPENAGAPAQLSVTDRAVMMDGLGETRTLSVEVKDVRGRTVQVPVEWQSDNPQVVEVDASGRLRANTNGSTRIRVRTLSTGGVGVSDMAYRAVTLHETIEVVVYQRAASVAVVGPAGALRTIGERSQLTVQVRDPGGVLLQRPYGIVWSTDTPGVIQINQFGEVSALDDGVGLIRARVEETSGALTLEVNATLRYAACAGAGIANAEQARNFLAHASVTGCAALPLLRRSGAVASGPHSEGN